MVFIKKTTQHLKHTNRSSRGSYLASTLIQDLQGQLQLALTLADTPQRPMEATMLKGYPGSYN